MKAQQPARRPDHQQRIDFGATRRGRTRRRTPPPSTPITGLTKSTSLDGREYDIACGQIDIGNAATRHDGSGWRRGACRPTADRGRADDGRRARRAAVVYMASLPLDANVQFMTVMATKMPFIGTGLAHVPRGAGERRRLRRTGCRAGFSLDPQFLTERDHFLKNIAVRHGDVVAPPLMT